MAEAVASAITAAIAEGGGTFVVEAWMVTATVQVATVTYGLYSANKRARAIAAANEFQGQDVILRGSDIPRWMVLGRTEPPIGLMYACLHGANNEFATVLLDVAHHEIDAVEDVLFNKESIGALGTGLWNGESKTGVVQPGSKWYRETESERGYKTTWPAAGGTITIPLAQNETLDAVSSIGNYGPFTGQTTGERVYVEGVDWEIDGNVITVLTDTFEGQDAVITHRLTTGEAFVRVRTWLGGSAGERDLELEADSGGEWKATSLRKGVATIAVTIKFDMELFGATGFPDIKALVRGAKVYNPVNGQTAWSDNAYLCTLYWAESPIGGGVPRGEIDQDLAIAGANACAESVQTGVDGNGDPVYQERYTVNGSISTEDTRFNNFRRLLGAMAGSACWSGGLWKIRPGVFSAPTFTLDDDDLAPGEKSGTPATAARDLFNTVTGRFTDPALHYQPNDFPPYASSTYIAQDNGESIEHPIDLPLTNSAVAAQRIGRQVMHRERNSYTWSATYKIIGAPPEPGERGYLRHKRRGWDTASGGLGKVFQLKTRALQMDGTVKMSFIEDAPEFFSEDYSELTDPDPAPNLNLPDPTYVPALVNFRLDTSAMTYRRTDDGKTVIPYVAATWDRSTDSGVLIGGEIVLWWKMAGQVEYTAQKLRGDATGFEIMGDGIGPLAVVNAYVVARNGAGVSSAKMFATHQCSIDMPTVNAAIAVGANLLENATFAYSAAMWEADPNGNAGAVSVFKPTDPAQWIAGDEHASPNNVALFNPGTSAAGQPVAVSKGVPCIPGLRMVAMAKLLPIHAQAFVGVRFDNAAGAWIDTQVIPPSEWVPDMAADAANVHDLARYVDRFLFVRPPGNARTARLLIGMSGTIAPAGNSGVFAAMPMLSFADESQTDPPRWNVGPNGMVDTAQIVDGATADLFESVNDTPDWGITVSPVNVTQVVPPTYGYPTRQTITATVQARMASIDGEMWAVIGSIASLGGSPYPWVVQEFVVIEHDGAEKRATTTYKMHADIPANYQNVVGLALKHNMPGANGYAYNVISRLSVEVIKK
jgi:hypothetical protein